MADQENQEILRNLHQALQPMILKLRDRKTRASALSSLANHLHRCQNRLVDAQECIDIGMRHGSELAKLTGMRILEVLLEKHLAIAYVGSPHNKSPLCSLVSTWDQMTFLAFTGILLRIFRCYDLLCTIRNGLAALKDRSASLNFMRAAAHTVLQDHPEIRTLIGQVLHSLSGEDYRSPQYCHSESGNQIGFH